MKEVRLSDVDRFVIKQLWAEWQDHLAQRLAVSKKLKAFVAKAPQREAEAREILKTAPGVGPVTAEVVLSELGDISRFRNAKAVCAYAGLVPVVRQSGERKSRGPEDHQGRLGTVAVGTGGGRLAAGRQQPEMGDPVLAVDASQR